MDSEGSLVSLDSFWTGELGISDPVQPRSASTKRTAHGRSKRSQSLSRRVPHPAQDRKVRQLVLGDLSENTLEKLQRTKKLRQQIHERTVASKKGGGKKGASDIVGKGDWNWPER